MATALNVSVPKTVSMDRLGDPRGLGTPEMERDGYSRRTIHIAFDDMIFGDEVGCMA